MSTIKTNAILDASGGNTTTINGTTPTAYNTMGKNLIINGDMRIAQRSTSESGLGNESAYKTLDRWQYNSSGTAGRFTMSQESVTDLAGFSNSLKLQCTTADTSIDAAEVFILGQALEGFTVQPLKDSSSSTKSFTYSFYARQNAARNVAVEVRTSSGTYRQVCKLFNIGTDWARYEFTVPASSSGMQLDNDNSNEMQIWFWLHAGSNYASGTLDTSWAVAINANRAAGIDSFYSSTSNWFEVTGVQLEVGSVATEFERRPYGMELALCQRYYQHSYATGTAVGTATSVGAAHQGGGQNGSTTGYLAGPWILFPVQLRTFPTVTVWDIGGNSGYCHRFTYAVGGANSQPYNIAATSDKSIYGYSSGSTNYAGVAVHWRVEAEL